MGEFGFARGMTPFTAEFRAAFADTDAAGIVHFTTVLFWAEATEEALFRQLQLPFLTREGSHLRGFPRVRIECDYRQPIERGDVVIISLQPAELSEKRLVWAFTAKVAGREVAAGRLTTVYATRGDDGVLSALLVPAPVLGRLQEYFKN